MRWSDEDDIWLSPSCGRKSCWIGIVQFRSVVPASRVYSGSFLTVFSLFRSILLYHFSGSIHTSPSPFGNTAHNGWPLSSADLYSTPSRCRAPTELSPPGPVNQCSTPGRTVSQYPIAAFSTSLNPFLLRMRDVPIGPKLTHSHRRISAKCTLGSTNSCKCFGNTTPRACSSIRTSGGTSSERQERLLACGYTRNGLRSTLGHLHHHTEQTRARCIQIHNLKYPFQRIFTLINTLPKNGIGNSPPHAFSTTVRKKRAILRSASPIPDLPNPHLLLSDRSVKIFCRLVKRLDNTSVPAPFKVVIITCFFLSPPPP